MVGARVVACVVVAVGGAVGGALGGLEVVSGTGGGCPLHFATTWSWPPTIAWPAMVGPAVNAGA
jgi:hypothetical protein